MTTQRFVMRNPADVGRTIAEARLLTSVSQTALAERSGIDRTYLSRMEGGLETVHLERIFDALRALGVKLEATLELDETPDHE